jgi:uncharacterized protein with ATP-grasp and redox domains
MAIDIRCKACFENNFKRLTEKFEFSGSQLESFSFFFKELMDESENMLSAEIQRQLQKKLYELKGIVDPYVQEKEESNQLALKLYDSWKPRVLDSENPFNLALRLAIAGNIMDFGANPQFNIHETIELVLKSEFAVDHSSELKEKIKSAQSILYLGDNAGEIVFDKLFIETMMHPYITYAVKGGPVINDITIEDANKINMNGVADVISNGYDAPSTILEKSSDEFLSQYNSAELIISKGQGNYEGLINQKDPRIFFLLMVKCDVIAELLGVIKGSFVVFN